MITLGSYSFCILDLVMDDVTGKLSMTKLWFHVANIIMSYVMLNQVTVDWELLATYGAVVGGSHVATLFMKLKYGVCNGTGSNLDMAQK